MVRNTLTALAVLAMSGSALATSLNDRIPFAQPALRDTPGFTANAIDDGLPPLQYDIGGETEADVIVNYIDRFKEAAPPLIRVKTGQALAECDRIQMQRYGAHYFYDGVLLGCLIRNNYTYANPVIVYSYDPADPGMGARLLRHEIGHLIGWPADHRRALK